MTRIAILGFALESNAFAPPCARADFEERGYYRGDEISTLARAEPTPMYNGIRGFYATMDARYGAGGWTPVPVTYAASMPAGPVEQGFFTELLAEFEAGLGAAGPVDGV
jgi:microcystin degradation protein MlrC